ncbi:MAG: hypothetical protein IJU60_04670 [Acholeplasmatales bacterium]|nr:hypothetical protein [Acholeplasmatales bacterium]
MKAYVVKTNKDSLGKDQYEFVEIKDLEIGNTTIEKKFDSVEAKVEFVKEDQDSKIKELEAQIKELNDKLVKLLKATLEVK